LRDTEYSASEMVCSLHKNTTKYSNNATWFEQKKDKQDETRNAAAL
jgi:hypothetical protein